MNNEIETYKFSLKTLENIIDSIEECNSSLDSNIKDNNKKIITELKVCCSKLNDIISNYNPIEKEDDCMNIDLVTKELRDTIKNECEKIEVFSKYNDDSDNYNYLLNDKFKELLNFINKSLDKLYNVDSYDESDMIATVINDKITDEKIELELIKSETYELLDNNTGYIVDSLEFTDYRNFINSKIFKSKDMIYDLRLFKENNKNILTDKNNLVISVLNNIVEKQIDELNKLCLELDELTNLDEDIIIDKNEQLKDKNDYTNKVMYILDELYNNNSSFEEIMERLLKVYEDEHPKVNEIIEEDIEVVDEKQKEIDTKEYRNNFTKLNKSFWEARAKASSEGIKYPSSLYEKKVKEYQNNYLIDNYNISLEALEREVEDYKVKYASELYMDKVYDEAIYILKEETLASIDEMCDESNGISMLDLKALELLNNDLMDVIREIGKVKDDENLNGFIDIEEYRKSVKLNSLIDKKEMIERRINIIKRKINNY